MKERVTEELMPRAFVKKRTTFVWIDPVNGWFVVDAGSPAKAEEVIEHLRHCLDTFLLKPVHTELTARGHGRLACRWRCARWLHHRP